MGTDRQIIADEPCKCGKGRIKVEYLTPDHPWPTNSYSVSTEIICDDCRKQFSLIEQDYHIVWVYNKNIDERKILQTKFGKKSFDFMQSKQVKNVLQLFRNFLEDQPSLAEIYRKLKSSGIISMSLSSFRRKWPGTESWIDKNISFRNLDKVLKLLELNYPETTQQIYQLDEMYELTTKSFPIVDLPVCKIPSQ